MSLVTVTHKHNHKHKETTNTINSSSRNRNRNRSHQYTVFNNPSNVKTYLASRRDLPKPLKQALWHAHRCAACPRHPSPVSTTLHHSKALPHIPDLSKLTKPPLLLVAEAPGLTETRLNQPLVGPSGQALWRVLSEFNITRDNTIIINTNQCRPVQTQNPKRNSGPTIETIETCKKHVIKPVLTNLPRNSIPTRALLLGTSALALVNPDLALTSRVTNLVLSRVSLPVTSLVPGHVVTAHVAPHPSTLVYDEASFRPLLVLALKSLLNP